MNKEEIEKRIDEIQQELNSLKEQLNEPEKKTGWEKPIYGQEYWFIDSEGYVWKCVWSENGKDVMRYNCGNCFTSEKLAANVSAYKSLDSRIRRRIAEICEPWKWRTNNSRKWFFAWNHNTNHMMIDWVESRIEYAKWYFDTREHAEQIIEEFEDELTWYFTEFKDRMDV